MTGHCPNRIFATNTVRTVRTVQRDDEATVCGCAIAKLGPSDTVRQASRPFRRRGERRPANREDAERWADAAG